MSVKSNVQIIYKEIPKGFPDSCRTFEIRKGYIVVEDVILNTDEILLRTLYASVDPYMRGRMRDPSVTSYSPVLIIGEVMSGGTISEVVKSNNPTYDVGDVVHGLSKWEEYSIVKPLNLEGMPESFATGLFKKIPNAKNSSAPLSYFLGVLGLPGLTAYTGLHKICEPLTPGQTLYVSAAAGAVGQVVGQYGKVLGLRVVGSAGDDEKVDYLLKDLGFDAAFNYKKHEDFETTLKEACPNGIDIYFDNVGGKMLDAVLKNCNSHARISICGMISQSNSLSEPEPIYNLIEVLRKRIRLQGFIVSDTYAEYGTEFIEIFTKFLNEGKLKYKESITKGIDTLPDVFVGIFYGKNFGKAVVQISDL